MTSQQRLERELPQILNDLAMGPYPDYIDNVLATTAQRRQRPAWRFPERWLPMVEIARQPVLAPRIPWRSFAVVIALIALLLAAVAAFIGAQPRLPEPFGLARNGLVAYDAGGDIYTADPVTGTATAIVTGPEKDADPRFSLDGTQIVFEREAALNRTELYVARSDGSQLTKVTPEPIVLGQSIQGEPWEPYQFSPDGRSVLIATADRGISIAQSDGTGIRQIDVGMLAYEPSFRPPVGAEILFVGEVGGLHSLFAVDASTGVVRTIFEPAPYLDLAGATWSPDGSRIAYWSWAGGDGITARVHVISADGTGDRPLPAPPGAVWSAISEWSNDGARLFMIRGYTSLFEDVRAAVIPVDGSGTGIEFRSQDTFNGNCCSTWQWAPDDSRIFGTPTDAQGDPLQQMILDPATGEVRRAPWTSTSDPTWQRRAP